MASELTAETERRLETEQNVWFGSVRADGRPHLAPVWFVWFEGKFYIGTDPRSVKARNIVRNPKVALALEGGDHPVICEGTAGRVDLPLPEGLEAAFFKKYEWKLATEEQYNEIVEVTPERWLIW